MGQQQLLLIVLGVIIAGIAVVVGINLFSSSAAESNRTAVISDLHHIAHLAQSYYKRPVSYGGGSGSFTGFVIPTPLVSTLDGEFSVSTAGTATQITIQGIGLETGNDGSVPLKYQMTVFANNTNFTLVKLN